jgi:hypothetical protein
MISRERFLDIAAQKRLSYAAKREESKGMRFRDDIRLLQKCRMELFGQTNSTQLPTEEQFLERVNEKWANAHIPKILSELAQTDYNYESKYKWGYEQTTKKRASFGNQERPEEH